MIRSALERTALTANHLIQRSYASLANMSTDPSKYKFNHSMIRVKDPKASVKFYELLGMKVIDVLKQPEAKFDLYFLAYDDAKSVSHGKKRSDREGLIELTHNYGSEEKEGKVYHNGNKQPQGFGHTCISVDNIQVSFHLTPT